MPLGRPVFGTESTRKDVRPSMPENKGEGKKEEAVFVPVEPKFTFDDLVLPEHVREEVMNVIVFEDWGLGKTHKYSKQIGINLWGEPGTGKTMAAHAIANHLGRKILIVNYADIESKYVGETPKNIRRVFEVGKATGSILFFDEADAILSRRVTNMSSATDVSVNQTRSVMLMLMNEYQDFIIFATNFISNFDPAFMRRIAVKSTSLMRCRCRCRRTNCALRLQKSATVFPEATYRTLSSMRLSWQRGTARRVSLRIISNRL